MQDGNECVRANFSEVEGLTVPTDGLLRFDAVRDKSGEFAVDTENHRMWFRASTPGMKGDRIDIPVKAWKRDLKNYLKKNPIFAWAHQYVAEGFPSLYNVMGHAVDGKLIDEGNPDKDGLYLLDDFAVDVNPMARMAWEFYQRRDLNTVSVGFDILEYHTEKRGEGDAQREVYVLDRSKLLEHSGCILPLDEDALAQRSRALMKESPEFKRAALDRAMIADDFGARLRAIFEDEYCTDLFCSVTTIGDSGITRPGWDESEEWIKYRIRDPKMFNGDTFVTLSIDVKAKGDVQILRGRYAGDKDDGKRHAQRIAFQKKAGWTMKAAKSWWADHKEDISRIAENADHVWLKDNTFYTYSYIGGDSTMLTDRDKELVKLTVHETIQELYRDKETNLPPEDRELPEEEPEHRRFIREMSKRVELDGNEVKEQMQRIRTGT